MSRAAAFQCQLAHVAERHVTLPRLGLSDIEIEREARETAARFAEYRVIREGLDPLARLERAGWVAGDRKRKIPPTETYSITSVSVLRAVAARQRYGEATLNRTRYFPPPELENVNVGVWPGATISR
jgi:hypothetical protein